jgi:hypothetical protein
MLKNEEVLHAAASIFSVPDKAEWKTTTSRWFKLNLLQSFCMHDKMNWVELGAAQGHTTILLSKIAKSVFSIDVRQENVDAIDCLQMQNVKSSNVDLYSQEFKTLMSNSEYDAAIIDAVHDYDSVSCDISNCLNAGVRVFVFDDYGAFPEVKKAVDEFISKASEQGCLLNTSCIGLPPGTSFPNTMFKTLVDWEGIIVRIDNSVSLN